MPIEDNVSEHMQEIQKVTAEIVAMEEEIQDIKLRIKNARKSLRVLVSKGVKIAK